MAKKMRLVSDNEYQALLKSSHLETDDNPATREQQRNHILKGDLPDDVKLALFMQISKEVNHRFNEFLNKPVKVEVVDVDDLPKEEEKQIDVSIDDTFILNNVAEKFRDKARAILDILREHPEQIEWDSYGGVTFFGEELLGSNMSDLLNYVLRDAGKWPTPPLGINRFILVCKRFNVPATFIKKDLREQFLGTLSDFNEVKSNSESVLNIPRIKNNLIQNWTSVFEDSGDILIHTSTPMKKKPVQKRQSVGEYSFVYKPPHDD